MCQRERVFVWDYGGGIEHMRAHMIPAVMLVDILWRMTASCTGG